MHTSAFPLLRKKKKTPNKITIFYDFQHLHGSLPTARRGRVCHLVTAISGGGELSVVQSARHTSHSLLTRTSDRGVKSGGGEAEDKLPGIMNTNASHSLPRYPHQLHASAVTLYTHQPTVYSIHNNKSRTNPEPNVKSANIVKVMSCTRGNFRIG